MRNQVNVALKKELCTEQSLQLPSLPVNDTNHSSTTTMGFTRNLQLSNPAMFMHTIKSSIHTITFKNRLLLMR